MIDARYYEVTPLPADNAELPGDAKIVVTYPLYQLGDWIVGYQVGQLEKKMEEDGRFVLLSYAYDENAKTLTLTARVRREDEMAAKVYLAGGRELLAALAIIGGAVAYLAYETRRTVKLYYLRPQAIADEIKTIQDNPALTDEVKDRMTDELLKRMEDRSPTADAIRDAGLSVTVIGAGAIALFLYLAWSHR